MSLELLTACPLCGSANFINHLSAKDYTATGEVFEIQRCANCEFTFTNPRPSQDTIGKYYQSENYISHSGSNRTLFGRLYFFTRTYMLKRKLTLIKQFKSHGTILDYGCGTGAFLTFVKQMSWDANGVEPNERAREIAQKESKSFVYESIEKLPPKEFDVITLWHVLEHIHDLKPKVEQLKLRLKKDGVLFIAVPNHESPDAEKYGPQWAGYDVPRHLWHFSKKSMQHLLDQAGIEIIKIAPLKLDAFYVSLLSEGYLYPNQNKLISALKAFISGLKSNYIAGKNSSNSSLIYIAKKR